MTTPRRRVLRPPRPSQTARLEDPRLERIQSRLESEHEGLRRWMSKLKRAFHAVERHQNRITALERQAARLSQP